MFDEKRADYICAFLELLAFGSGDWAGKPFRLQDWQREPIREFYGNVTTEAEENRKFRIFQYLYLEIPKKNGKTEVAAGLGLYHLLGDGEKNPQVYICAADKDNATICYNAMCGMLDARPFLDKKVKRIPSKRKIELADGSGFVQVLSAEAYSKHGYNASCVIFDELHAQPNRALWDIMTFGAGSARLQPVWIVLTTAGDDPDRHSIGWEIHEQCRRILAARAGTGPIEDDNPIWLPVMYGMPDDPEEIEKIDIYDEAVWRRCNPSIGVTIPLRTIRQEAADAKKSEAKERLFRWLRLNQWIATKAVGWLPLTLYDRTQWHVEALEEVLKGNALRAAMRQLLHGKKCFAGLDLAATTDLAALVLEFPPQPGLDHWVVLTHAWRPREGVLEAEKRDHVPYRDWERAGYITLCDGDMNDFDQIKDAIREVARLYKLQILGVDPYLSREITGTLMKEGINVLEIRQTMTELSPPMKDIERKLRGGEMKHDHNTASRWCFGNVRCAIDGNENMKPMKNKSIGRIDITVAWIIAHAAAMSEPENKLADLLATGKWSL
ncbi:MAG: terminase TerL endonuclease subunit [Oscillospiraceae bacterium]